MVKILPSVFIFTLLIGSSIAFASPENPSELLENGAGHSSTTPIGLQTAKGIQKQILLEIADVQATSTTASSTTITWTTNKASDSRVIYWIGTTTPSSTVEVYSSSSILHHEIGLEGLLANKTYSYLVFSEDLYGKVATSGVRSFRTR